MNKLIALVMLLLSIPAQSQTIGVHLASIHDREGYNGDNPGIYYKDTSGFTIGTYYNSERRTSNYIGYTQSYTYFDISYLCITGYNKSILPAIIPSVKFGPVRVFAVVNPLGASAISFAIEKQL